MSKLRPANDRLAGLLYDTHASLITINTLVSSETLSQDDLQQFTASVQKSLKLLNSVHLGLRMQSESSS